MSLEHVVRIFAKKRGFSLKETKTGLELKDKNREWLFYEEENGVELLLCGKAFALTGIDESMIYVTSSAKEQELVVHVRYGCLRDYINQLRTSGSPILIDLRQRLQSRLDSDDHAGKWAQEAFSKFNQVAVYNLLRHFYP